MRLLKLAAFLSLWVVFFVLVAIVHLWISILGLPNRWKILSRLNRNYTLLLRLILNIKVTIAGDEGQLERGGYVIIANHVSYVDGIVLGSIFPIVFVSKREVKKWPIVGQWNVLCGTIFINRQRKELDMDRSFDRRYAAQQVRRAVLARWASCWSCLFTATTEPCSALVLGRRCGCNADCAAEFPLADALEFPLCAIGKEREGKWARCNAAASAVCGAAISDVGVCLVASGAVGVVVSDFSSGQTLWSSFLGLPERVGLHASAQG